MRIKAIYRKNLKMSDGKIAAQVAHAVIGLGITDPRCTIVVLKVSDAKFQELTNAKNCYIHRDLGFTEVEADEATAAAWVEEE
jgi:peptidyl-tRNA hydrolase